MTSSIASAQVEQVARYEKDVKENGNDFLVVNMREQGLALLREKDKFNNGNRVWEFITLDTSLAETWNTEFEISNRLNLVGHDYVDGKLYYLFRQLENNSNELELYSVNLRLQDFSTYTIKQELDFQLTEFSMMGDFALFGGYMNKQPLVTLYDLHEKSNRIVPGFFNSNVELLDLQPNSNNTFNVLLAERTSKEKRKLILKTMDVAGTLLMDDEVELESNKYILAAQTSALVRDEMMVIGTWTSSSGVRQASGFFTLQVDPFTQQTPRYYDFSEFDQFLNFLKPRKIIKIKNSAQARRNTGKLPDYKTYVNPVRIEETSAGFTLLAEVYQPGATTQNFRNTPYYTPFGMGNPYFNPYGFNPYYNPYYNPYRTPFNSNIEPDESRVLHSSVIQFDASGKYVADVGFKMDQMKTSSLDHASDFYQYSDQTTILYKREKHVRQAVYDKEGALVHTDTVAVHLSVPTEEIRHETNHDGLVRHWYRGNFFVWGYHTLADQAKRWDDRNRYLFYVHKLSRK